MSEAPSATKIAEAPTLGGLRRAGQVLLGLCIIGGIAAAWRWRGEFDPATLTATIGGSPVAPLIFLLLQTVASLVFVPRSLLGVAAGLVFGMWWGLLWAVLGSVTGAIAGFLVSRYIHSGLFDRARWRRLTAILERVERGGWRMVATFRLVPVIPHSLSNYALGLTRVSLRDYALGSFLGQLPLTVAAVEIGAAGERAMRGSTDWLMPTVIGFAALASTLVIPAVLRKRRAPAE